MHARKNAQIISAKHLFYFTVAVWSSEIKSNKPEFHLFYCSVYLFYFIAHVRTALV